MSVTTRQLLFSFFFYFSCPWLWGQVNPFIMSEPFFQPQDRALLLLELNPKIESSLALNFAVLYEEEAVAEGVNPELAFAQMLLETGALRFGGQVRAEQNNFAGLGAVDGGEPGLFFDTPRQGIRAQIQHLKYYGSTLPLNRQAVNPRLRFISRGIAPTVWQLSQRWASDPDYGKKIVALMECMLSYSQAQRQDAARKVF